MFGIGSVLATGFRMWLRNLPRFLLVALLFYIPVQAWTFLQKIDGVAEWMLEHYYGPLYDLHPTISSNASGKFLADAFIVGAIATWVVARIRGEDASIARGIATAARRSPRIIGGAIITHLGTTGVMVGISIVMWRNDWYSRGEYIYYLWAVLYIVMISLWVTVLPMIAVERRGVFSALRRNFAFGHRVKVFAIVLVEQVILWASYYGLFYALLPSIYDFDNYQSRMVIYDYVISGLEIVFATLNATLAAVTYEKLRAAKEGPTQGQLHAVFQ